MPYGDAIYMAGQGPQLLMEFSNAASVAGR